jgi:hypothetical protein
MSADRWSEPLDDKLKKRANSSHERNDSRFATNPLSPDKNDRWNGLFNLALLRKAMAHNGVDQDKLRLCIERKRSVAGDIMEAYGSRNIPDDEWQTICADLFGYWDSILGEVRGNSIGREGRSEADSSRAAEAREPGADDEGLPAPTDLAGEDGYDLWLSELAGMVDDGLDQVAGGF